MFQNNEIVAMLVNQENPMGVELPSYVKVFFLQDIFIDAGYESENTL